MVERIVIEVFFPTKQFYRTIICIKAYENKSITVGPSLFLLIESKGVEELRKKDQLSFSLKLKIIKLNPMGFKRVQMKFDQVERIPLVTKMVLWIPAILKNFKFPSIFQIFLDLSDR